MKGKTHDSNHDLTFSAQTINCECHSIRSMFRVLGIYNFDLFLQRFLNFECEAKAMKGNRIHVNMLKLACKNFEITLEKLIFGEF